ncbi:hypothetical protein P4O66_005443 [Electrophorus voltai]|uniref:Uncharacterized protein n=1 Tax=Electrophorus voltai TaxID=2609070 RepID=A0AAD9A1A4_9TELE|nr:hypothetical protein P4O66_005443 [Electrophorus voltai]
MCGEAVDVEVRGERSREHLVCDSVSPLPAGAVTFKIRSQSVNTDTTTSDVTSLSSSPSRETAPAVAMDTDGSSLSSAGSLLPRPYASPRDALGYAALKRLQQQRLHLPHSEALTSSTQDVFFTDTITMKTRSLDSRLTHGFLKALSFMSLDKDPLSPINSTLQCSTSLLSVVSSAPYSTVKITFVGESSYLQRWRRCRSSLTLMVRADASAASFVDASRAALKQQVSITELLNSSCLEQCHLLGGEAGGKVISEDGPVCRVLRRKEIVRLVINLSSSVAIKSHDTGLLTRCPSYCHAVGFDCPSDASSKNCSRMCTFYRNLQLVKIPQMYKYREQLMGVCAQSL